MEKHNYLRFYYEIKKKNFLCLASRLFDHNSDGEDENPAYDSYSSSESSSDEFEKITENKIPIRFQKIMFDGYKLNVFMVLTMIVAFCLRFQISTVAREQLIQMILLLAGPQFENFKIGNYVLSKLFDPPDYAIVYNYFCNKCNEVLYSTSKKKFKKCTLTCLKCNLEQNFTLKSKNYFI